VDRATEIEAARWYVRRRRVGGIDVLGRRLRREFELNTGPGEEPRLCLRGERGHALVFLDDRLLVLKRGFQAGTTFGAMAATIFYRDVTGIQVRVHLLTGWIEISSPSFQGGDHKRSTRRRSTDPDAHRLPNCIPISRRYVPLVQVALGELRGYVAEAKREHDSGGIVDQLERVAELRLNGVLDESEFACAKSRILREADQGPRALRSA
jgi:hypothetical protein